MKKNNRYTGINKGYASVLTAEANAAYSEGQQKKTLGRRADKKLLGWDKIQKVFKVKKSSIMKHIADPVDIPADLPLLGGKRLKQKEVDNLRRAFVKSKFKVRNRKMLGRDDMGKKDPDSTIDGFSYVGSTLQSHQIAFTIIHKTLGPKTFKLFSKKI